MRTKCAVVVLATVVGAVVGKAQVEITSFSHNGEITWNAPTNSTCTIEWGSSLTGGTNWDTTWIHHKDIAITNGSGHANVPMFFRITCWTNGLLHPMPMQRALTFNASNNLGQTWTQVVTFAGSLRVDTMLRDYALYYREEFNPGEEAYGNAMLYFRSTDKEYYMLQSITNEVLVWREAPVGTVWTNEAEGTLVRIVARENVTVPAGTFGNCIKFKKSDLLETPTKTWYEWLKPGKFIVRIEDHNCGNPSAAPLVYELQSWKDR